MVEELLTTLESMGCIAAVARYICPLMLNFIMTWDNELLHELHVHDGILSYLFIMISCDDNYVTKETNKNLYFPVACKRGASIQYRDDLCT